MLSINSIVLDALSSIILLEKELIKYILVQIAVVLILVIALVRIVNSINDKTKKRYVVIATLNAIVISAKIKIK